MRSSRGTPRRGFSLIETAFASIVVGVMFAAAMRTVGATITARQRQAAWRQGDSLACDLLSEVLRARYEEPCSAVQFGLEPGEGAAPRTDWDDVDDYSNLNEALPVRHDGAPIPGAGAYRRKVRVTLVASDLNPSMSDVGLKKIVVTVTDASGYVTRLVALRTAEGFPDRRVDPKKTFVTWAGASIRVGAQGAQVSSGTDLVNLPE
ncbi:MAG: hypothetical protein H7Y88_12560 [Phycisphaerales bacterium]|nr:hypothetical protein [Phycisphaerales bacterium]